MHEFTRDEINQLPLLSLIRAFILDKHQVADHTRKTLIKNQEVEDFCEESRHFALLSHGSKDLHVHYDICSWFKSPAGVIIKVESIAVYDNYLEYEIARQKGLSSTPHSFNPNQN